MKGLRFPPGFLQHCPAGTKKYVLRLCAVLCVAAIMLGARSVAFAQAADTGGVANYLTAGGFPWSRILGLIQLDNINFKSNVTGKVTHVESGLQVTFKGQRGTMTLNCNGNTGCESAGLNGRQLKIKQDMQIVIDVIGAGVVGQSQGILFVRQANGKIRRVRFTTDITGTAACVGNANACNSLSLTLNGTGNVLGLAGQVIGHMDMNLTGAMSVSRVNANRGKARFSDLVGGGTLQFIRPGHIPWGAETN